jgi:hypothetical protein
LTPPGRQDRGLGPFLLVSAADARDAAFEIRRGARQGKDIARQRSAPPFRIAFEHHFAQRKKGLKNEKHTQRWRAGMERHTAPRIGDRPVSEISHDEIRRRQPRLGGDLADRRRWRHPRRRRSPTPSSRTRG